MFLNALEKLLVYHTKEREKDKFFNNILFCYTITQYFTNTDRFVISYNLSRSSR